MKLIHQAKEGTPRVLSLGFLSEQTNAVLQGEASTLISGVGSLTQAKEGQLTFLADPKYQAALLKTQASAVVLHPRDASMCSLPCLISEEPRQTFARIIDLLYPAQERRAFRHPTAVIGEECHIAEQVYIGPHCVIEDHVILEEGVIVEAGCFIGSHSHLGKGTVLYPRVTLYQGCRIGENCVIHTGVVIGSDGFGYVKEAKRWLKVPQVGGVVIGDRVEIGANTTIDRGTLEPTEIGGDVILDNQIQIAHNVRVQEGSAIAACVGIAGSTHIGKHCLIGGGARINGHLSIADHVHIVGCSNVAQSITEAGAYGSAITAASARRWKKNLARFHHLDEIVRRLRALEKKQVREGP